MFSLGEAVTSRKMLNTFRTAVLLYWATLAKPEWTSGTLWQQRSCCDNYTMNRIFVSTYVNIPTPMLCYYRCKSQTGCELFFHNQNNTTCLIYSLTFILQWLIPNLPPNFEILKRDVGYKLFRNSAETTCPQQNGYDFDVNSHLCLKLEGGVNRTWEDAQRYCCLEGGHLVIINFPVKFILLKIYIKMKASQATVTPYLWLGATYSETEGLWRWTDNSLLTNPDWDAEQPGNQGEYALAISTQSLRLHDAYLPHGYICEIDLQ